MFNLLAETEPSAYGPYGPYAAIAALGVAAILGVLVTFFCMHDGPRQRRERDAQQQRHEAHLEKVLTGVCDTFKEESKSSKESHRFTINGLLAENKEDRKAFLETSAIFREVLKDIEGIPERLAKFDEMYERIVRLNGSRRRRTSEEEPQGGS